MIVQLEIRLAKKSQWILEPSLLFLLDLPHWDMSQAPAQKGFFPPTPWSLISRIRQPAHPDDQKAALNEVCTSYWPAVYAFIRHQGRSPSDSEDLTQDFFCRLVDDEMLNGASADKGRLRSLLAVILKRFLVDQIRRETSLKRGGNRIHLTVDPSNGEDYFDRLSSETISPDDFFDRVFAASLMDQAVRRLRDDYFSQEKGHVFEVLKTSLLGPAAPGELTVWADRLNTSEATLRVAVHRLRKRFRESFRSVVMETVVNPVDLDEELTVLLNASS